MNISRISKAIFTAAVSISLLGGPSAAFSQAGGRTKLPDGITRVTTVEGIVEGITEYRLANGLKVLMFPDQTKQTITVNMTYLVGSRHENYGETGMAHLLEHMLFKGTPKHPDVSAELNSHGTRPNGSTWYDRTNYFETFSATDENLQWALDLESDRMVNSYVARKDLDSEFSVVRNEMENGENSPQGTLMQKTTAVAFDWHNYGKDTIGARSDVENVPIDRLQAFYRKYYQPDNAVLLVAGRFDEAKTLDLVAKFFGPLPKPTRVIQHEYTVEPAQDGEREVTVRRTGDTQWVMAGYHIPAYSHPDGAAVQILASIMGDAPSGRLYKALVEGKKASSVFNFAYPTKEPGFLLFGAELKKDMSLDAARNAMTATLEDVAKAPPTKVETDRARTALLTQVELALNDPNNVGLELSEWIARGDWRLYFVFRDRLRSVTPEDVRRVGTNYLKQYNRTLGIFIPVEKPDRVQIPKLTDDEIAATVKDYKGDENVAKGEVFDPSPANIDSRTHRSKIGGIDAAFLPKQNRGNSVVAYITLRLGDERSLMNRSTAGEMAAQLLQRGTTKHTRQQIQDEFDRLKARVNIGGSATSVNVSVETTRQNLPAVLRLIGEILTEPSFPQTEFDQLKQETLTAIEAQRTDPAAIAITTLNQYFNPYPKGHPLYSKTLDEEASSINSATLDDVKRFYKDFYGASSGQMTVVGDFDEKEVAGVAQSIFGEWKSPSPFTRVKTEYSDVSPINRSIETPDKANAFFFARSNIRMRDDDPDYAAMVIGNYILGGSGTLGSRLGVRIRQKEGLSYGVGSQLSVSSIDRSGTFLVFAIYAPENAAKLEAAFKDEISKAVTSGFTADEVEAAKKGWLQGRQLSRAIDGELSGLINNYMFLNRTIAWDADIEAKIRSLTPAQINAAMAKYLIPASISIVKAGDFAKSKAKTAN